MNILTSAFIFIGLCILWRLYIKFTTGIYHGKERLDGKTVIVTGANSGIGYESAKDFAKRGARVLLVCRNMNSAQSARIKIIEETGNINIQIYRVDFSSLDSIRKGANDILNNEDIIDILLNNAGANDTGYDKVSIQGLNVLMQTNYFGPFLFTNILLGRIKNSAPSRIINVSSIAHLWSTLNINNVKNTKRPQEDIIYANSKLGIILFTKELAKRIYGTGVTTNCLNPGVFPSNIMKNKNFIFRFIWDKCLPFIFKTTEEAAQTSIYLCVSPDVKDISGEYFSECKLAKSSKKSMDSDFAKELWDLTEKAVNLMPCEIHY